MCSLSQAPSNPAEVPPARASRDGAGANRNLRAGWITFAVLAVLATLFWIMVLGSGMMSNRNGMGSN